NHRKQERSLAVAKQPDLFDERARGEQRLEAGDSHVLAVRKLDHVELARQPHEVTRPRLLDDVAGLHPTLVVEQIRRGARVLEVARDGSGRIQAKLATRMWLVVGRESELRNADHLVAVIERVAGDSNSS